MSDYKRSEVEDVIKSGPSGGPDYAFKVKAFGTQDSKHLSATRDQLRCLADVLDETNPPTLLPLANGHRVIRADVKSNTSGQFPHEGVVLADQGEGEHERYVVWRVYLHRGECRWLAEHGEYSSNLDRAVRYYDRRRGVAVAE